MPIALITGASRGIGLATAEYLAMAGYTVYAGYRGSDPSEGLLELSQKGLKVKTIPIDVTSNDSVKRAVEHIFKQEGAIDVVVNNAGFGIYGPIYTHSDTEIDDLINTNFKGPIRVNREVIPLMLKKGKGHIIHVGSISGVRASANLPGYSFTKASLDSVAASDAAELGPKGISVSVIQAGTVDTDFASNARMGALFNQIKDPVERAAILARRKHWGQNMDAGQSPYDVAKTIHEAITSKEYRLWWQTSPQVTAMVGAHCKDTTGNSRIPIIPKL